ncbi:MAG: hypothetical protein LBT33_08660, partial [Spirochaetia bacterium]|nr:hypothetical protein [Spirochaetia bacterium]
MKNLGASSEVSSFGKELDFMAWFIPRSLSDTNLFTQTDGLTGASSGVWTMPSKSTLAVPSQHGTIDAGPYIPSDTSYPFYKIS